MENQAKYTSKSWHAIGRVLLLLFWLNPILLSAQNYPTRHFTMRDGLPSMGIQCIYKDSRGLLWIGTRAGLCTFDGSSFHIFKKSEGMTASQIWAIAEDDKGNLWFGSMGEGIYKYDGVRFKRFTKKDGLEDDRIRVLYWSKKFNCLVAGGYDYISCIKDEKITSFRGSLTDKIFFGAVTGIIDAGEFIYITSYSHHNPVRFYPDKNEFISTHDKGMNYPLSSFSSFISSKGDTVFSNYNFGVWLKNKNGILKNDTIGQIFGITEDKRGDLWFASWSIAGMNFSGGVFRYDGKTFQNYTSAFGITDREVWTVFYDREQNILWIGTLNEGLYKIPFSAITRYPPSYFNLEQNNINNLFIDSKNTLWISGDRELIRMSPDGTSSLMDKHQMILTYRRFWNNKRITQYPPNFSTRLKPVKMDAGLLHDFEKQTKFYFNRVIEDNDGSIIFANEFGLFRYNEEKRETVYLGPEGPQSELSLMGDTLINSDLENTVLNKNFRSNRIGLIGNWLYPPALFIHFTQNGDPKFVTRLVKNGFQNWYATRTSGLWMSEGMRLINFNKTDSTISNSLNDICFDEHGHVIFGSNTGEITIATFSNDSLNIDFNIDSENGLQGNSISWLVADQKGKLWAGTNVGLNCIDLDSLYNQGKYIIRFIDEEEGYTGQMAKKAVLDHSGNIWMSGGDQLIRLNTNDLLTYQANYGKVVLKSLQINNHHIDSLLQTKINSWTLLPNEYFNLKHTDNDLIFSIDVFNYYNRSKDRFRYKLEGYDNDWNEWSTSREAVYTNLPPGKYKFIAESINLYTLTQTEPLYFEFTIWHPIWGKWQIQVILIFLLFVLIAIIVGRYVENEKQKQKQKSDTEKTIAQLEMQALQAQMNPHFIFNCINGIQYYVLSNKMDEALAYISDFSKVVRGSLENASINLVPLEKEIEFLNSYLKLELMRFEGKFDYKITCNNIENPGSVFLPPMLIQPYVENAVRHGFMQLNKKGHLAVVFEKVAEDMLKCTITDNGVGRKKANLNEEIPDAEERLHSGSITEKRIRLFNSPSQPEKYRIVYTDLIQNGSIAGLKVELYIPLENG